VCAAGGRAGGRSDSEREPILSEEQIRALFMNVEDLLKHHKGLLHRVEWIMLWSGTYCMVYFTPMYG
jgi:hypothetical protein